MAELLEQESTWQVPEHLDVLYHKGCGGVVETTCQMAMPHSECSKCGMVLYFAKEIIKVKYKQEAIIDGEKESNQ